MQYAADNHLSGWCAAEKLELLRHVCTELGVYTAPCCIEDVWLVPLYSWYHASFDAEADIQGALPAHQVSPRHMPLSSPPDVKESSAINADHGRFSRMYMAQGFGCGFFQSSNAL